MGWFTFIELQLMYIILPWYKMQPFFSICQLRVPQQTWLPKQTAALIWEPWTGRQVSILSPTQLQWLVAMAM